MTAATRREALLVATCSLLGGAALCAPLLLRLGDTPTLFDWDQLLTFHWVPYESVVRDHEFPFWNPYMCGGTPLLANPQTRFLSPFFLLHLLVGPVVGLQLEIWLHLALAIGGGYVLGRALGLSRVASCATAAVFPASTMFALHFSVGHTTFYGDAWLPWLLAAGVWSFQTRRLFPAALAGLILALIIGEAGLYPAPHGILLLGLLACGVAWQRLSLFPFGSVLCSLLFMAGFAAPKLLPVARYMDRYPRYVDSTEANSLSLVFSALFSRNQDLFRPVPSDVWTWHEQGAYIGPCAALLVLAALIFTEKRRIGPWGAPAVLMLLLAFGDWGTFSPWHLLHRLPIFSSQHVPSRFLFEFVLCVAVLAGFGADALGERFGARGRSVAIALIGLGALDAGSLGWSDYPYAYAAPVQWVQPLGTFAQSRDPAPASVGSVHMLARAQANRGTVNCYDPLHPHNAAIPMEDARYRGEVEVDGPGHADLQAFSINAVVVWVDLPAAGHVIVNQNADPGWTITDGNGRIVPGTDRLELEVPAGRQTIRLRHRSTPFEIGIVLCVMAVAGMTWIARREKKA